VEAIVVFLTVVSAGFASSPEIMDRVAADPACFAELYDLVLHGLVKGGSGEPSR